MVVQREQWKTDLREYLYISGVVLALLAVVAGFYYFIDEASVVKALAIFIGKPGSGDFDCTYSELYIFRRQGTLKVTFSGGFRKRCPERTFNRNEHRGINLFLSEIIFLAFCGADKQFVQQRALLLLACGFYEAMV